MENRSNFMPKTLGDFNNALVSLSLKPVDKARLDEILATEPKSRLVQAINRARVDKGSLAYLSRFFGAQGQQQMDFNGQDRALPPLTAPPAACQQQRRAQDPLPERPQNQAAPVSTQQAETADDEQTYPDTDGPESDSAGRTYVKKHCYGAKAALLFEADTTRNGMHTVAVDAADATGPKQYNWAGKLRLQLTRDELLVAMAVLLGMLPRCEYKNHGEDKSKGFSIEDQGDKLFIRVFGGGQKIKAVPVTPEDAFYVAQIFLSQIKKNSTDLDASNLLLLLQRVVAARKKPKN